MSYERDVRKDMDKQTRAMIVKLWIIAGLTLVAIVWLAGCGNDGPRCTPTPTVNAAESREAHQCFKDPKTGEVICK